MRRPFYEKDPYLMDVDAFLSQFPCSKCNDGEEKRSRGLLAKKKGAWVRDMSSQLSEMEQAHAMGIMSTALKIKESLFYTNRSKDRSSSSHQDSCSDDFASEDTNQKKKKRSKIKKSLILLGNKYEEPPTDKIPRVWLIVSKEEIYWTPGVRHLPYVLVANAAIGDCFWFREDYCIVRPMERKNLLDLWNSTKPQKG